MTIEAMSHSEHCRVYWGHSGCDLPRGHDSGRASRVHRQLEPSEQTVTPLNAFLFGEDLTDEERRQVAELWGVAPWKPCGS